MITAASLNAKSVKDLGKVADRYGVPGWRSLNKEQLVKAIVRATQKKSAPSAKAAGKAKPSAASKPGVTSKSAAGAKSGGGGKPAAAKPVAAQSAAQGKGKSSPSAGKSGSAPAVARKSPPASSGKAAQGSALIKASSAKGASAKATSKPTPGKAAADKASPQKAAAAKAGSAKAAAKPPSAKARAKSTKVQQRIQNVQAERDRQKNLAGGETNGHSVVIHSVNGHTPGKNGEGKHEASKSPLKKDRVVLLVRDAYWLQAVWELTRQSVERAQVALAQQWHTAKPVLRLIELESNSTTSSVEQVGKVIAIHGGVNTWFIDVNDSPKTFRVDVGYMAANGKFFALARSNSVTTPRPGSRDGLENNWSDIASDCEKIYALSGGFSDEAPTGELQEVFEERLGRPMNGPAGSRYGVGADKVFNRRNEFQFEVDAEMIIFGRTRANARVTLAGNPIKLRQDGTFAARLALPDRRQVLPIVASSADGIEQHTVVIAVERNTKVMEPMVREAND